MTEVVTIGDCTLYHGDCLGLLGSVSYSESLITDPVWPNCPTGLLPGSDGNQGQLLADCFKQQFWRTVVLVLGFDSDPRFLSAIPADHYPFIRSQQMPYAVPGYRGRLLGGDEVAYAFGEIPKGHQGLIPGRLSTEATQKADRETGHPCPRSDMHMTELVHHWSRESVLDPFMGTGATGVACANLGRKFVGIEIDRKYFDIACERIDQAYSQQRLFA